MALRVCAAHSETRKGPGLDGGTLAWLPRNSDSEASNVERCMTPTAPPLPAATLCANVQSVAVKFDILYTETAPAPAPAPVSETRHPIIKGVSCLRLTRVVSCICLNLVSVRSEAGGNDTWPFSGMRRVHAHGACACRAQRAQAALPACRTTSARRGVGDEAR